MFFQPVSRLSVDECRLICRKHAVRVCQSDRQTVSQRDPNEGGDSESEAEVYFLSVPNKCDKVSIGK